MVPVLDAFSSFTSFLGLGKTIQILALIAATLDDVKQKMLLRREEFGDDKDEKVFRHATLIIVPPALLSQWVLEVQKVCPWLVVDALIHGSSGDLKRVQQPSNSNQEEADIVVTTYNALEDNYASSTKGRQKSRQTKNSNSGDVPVETFVEKVHLANITWGRIVLDEMQEIRSWTTRVSKLVNSLASDCRWMLSGK